MRKSPVFCEGTITVYSLYLENLGKENLRLCEGTITVDSLQIIKGEIMCFVVGKLLWIHCR